MLAEIGDNSAGGEDLLREWRERAQARIPRGRAQNSGAEIERHSISIVHQSECVRGFEDRDAEVDAVAEEDSREALRDDPADTVLCEGGDRVLARAAASEILAAHHDVAWPHLFGESGPRIAERVCVELVLADHERRVAARDDLVRVEVVAENPGPRHQSSISAATPTRAAATMSSRERSPDRTEAAPRRARSARRRATSSSNASSSASRYGRGSSMTPVSAATAATYGEPMKIDASGEPIRPR